MRTKISICLSTILALTVTSCVDTLVPDIQVPEGEIPLNISSSIDQNPTKVTADGFEDKDALGLYAVNYENDNQTPGTLKAEGNQADHAKYVFNEADWKWNSVRPVYYKDVNTNVDLYVYYPYAEPDNVEAWNFEVQKDQSTIRTDTSLGGYEASDFLWGKVENVTPTESKIPVRLTHRMAGVEVKLQQGEGFGEGEFESLEKYILVTGTTRKASINFSTGDVSPIGGPQATGIVMAPQTDGGFRAIVVPQAVEAGTYLFSITIDGIVYRYKKDETISYETGKLSTFTINVNRKSTSGEYELELADFQISPWVEDRNTHEAEARQYYVVNVETPGTLGRLIKADKKNPDKIRNLKVTGQITDTDFYFMRDSMEILEAVNLKEVKVRNAWYSQYDENGNYLINEKRPIIDDVIPLCAFTGKKTLVYFSFPEIVTHIGESAFMGTNLSGSLALPDDVISVCRDAFYRTKISSVSFGEKIQLISDGAFYECNALTGELHLPGSLKYIGISAFYNCRFSGRLILPENLEEIGGYAFRQAGTFIGNLEIPEKIRRLDNGTFANSGFNQELLLNNTTSIGASCFQNCGFTGDLVIPEGVISIEQSSFYECDFKSIIFPSTLKTIETDAFARNNRLSELVFPEGLVSIGSESFSEGYFINSISLPSTLQTIGERAFSFCTGISGITSYAIEPPSIHDNTFLGVAKDNFALMVPEQSVVRYKTETGWSDFKKINAHYDFSISKQLIRTLNKGVTKKLVLRCPAGYSWSIESSPDWVEVNPTSGIGKTDITITVHDMSRTSELFDANIGSFQYPSYVQYAGRSGEIVFKIEENGYSDKLTIEQYDCDYADGDLVVNQRANTGPGIDIVFIGEGYDAKDIVDGKFLDDAQSGYKHFFDIEPYATYRDYFNVSSIVSLSGESGIETNNTKIENKFITQGILDLNACFSWVKQAIPGIILNKSVVILIENNPIYGSGITYMYGDGTALSVCEVSQEAYPYDYRGTIQHEAGGHAFGKLGDEYIYHTAYIGTCPCSCCNHADELLWYQSLGWFKNLSLSNDASHAPWGHLVYDPRYSNVVDFYEGGYFHTRGVYRSEVTSCMNNNIPYFSAISRQVIVERIKEYAGEEFSLEDFIAHDSFAVGTKSTSVEFDWTFGVDPLWNRGPEGGSVIYMGDHPNIK